MNKLPASPATMASGATHILRQGIATARTPSGLFLGARDSAVRAHLVPPAFRRCDKDRPRAGGPEPVDTSHCACGNA